MSEIDECMVVGFKPGTLTLTVADVGGGKSTMMLNIAFNLFKKNHNVMFLPLEMPFEEIFKKFLSRETLIDFNKLANPALLTDQDWEILKSHGDIIKKFNQKFIWADVKSRPTVSEIKRAIERKLKYFKPAVVVIDYIANIKPDAGSDNWLAIGDILKELRAMGKEHDFAILSAAQLTRDGIKKLKNDKDMSKTPGSEDLRGSHEYSADSDNIFAQMPSLDEPNRKMLLYCIKARYGKKTFGDKNYAILDYYPEFSKIESSAVNNFTSSDSKLDDAIDFMQKINQDFDDELNDTSGSGDEFGWLDL
jgi:replicative DNA helicase